MHYWPSQDAKAKFSEVVRSALKSGPQGISVHGEKKCVILSQFDYETLVGHKKNLIDFLKSSPLIDINLDLSRDQSLDRIISLQE